MELIANKQDLYKNIKKIDKYLEGKVDPEYSYALDLVKRGTCFIALLDGNNAKFYPSRFIGYKDNDMNAHESNEYKDGKETNPQISSIIGSKPTSDVSLEQMYKDYCEFLGFSARDKGAFGVERKYWRIRLNDLAWSEGEL